MESSHKTTSKKTPVLEVLDTDMPAGGTIETSPEDIARKQQMLVGWYQQQGLERCLEVLGRLVPTEPERNSETGALCQSILEQVIKNHSGQELLDFVWWFDADADRQQYWLAMFSQEGYCSQDFVGLVGSVFTTVLRDLAGSSQETKQEVEKFVDLRQQVLELVEWNGEIRYAVFVACRSMLELQMVGKEMMSIQGKINTAETKQKKLVLWEQYGQYMTGRLEAVESMLDDAGLGDHESIVGIVQVVQRVCVALKEQVGSWSDLVAEQLDQAGTNKWSIPVGVQEASMGWHARKKDVMAELAEFDTHIETIFAQQGLEAALDYVFAEGEDRGRRLLRLVYVVGCMGEKYQDDIETLKKQLLTLWKSIGKHEVYHYGWIPLQSSMSVEAKLWWVEINTYNQEVAGMDMSPEMVEKIVKYANGFDGYERQWLRQLLAEPRWAGMLSAELKQKVEEKLRI